jgi:hypothetical protein
MARVVRVKFDHPIVIGEAVVHVRQRKGGGVELVIEAPRHVAIRGPRGAATQSPDVDPDQLRLPIGELPELPQPIPPADDLPF